MAKTSPRCFTSRTSRSPSFTTWHALSASALDIRALSQFMLASSWNLGSDGRARALKDTSRSRSRIQARRSAYLIMGSGHFALREMTELDQPSSNCQDLGDC